MKRIGIAVLGLIWSTCFANPLPTHWVITQEVKAVTWHPPLDAVGTIQPSQGVVLQPGFSGHVDAIDVPSGATVHAGQPIIRIDEQTHLGKLEQAKAQAHLAELRLKRATTLLQNHVISQWIYDQAQANHLARQGQLKIAQATYQNAVIRAPFSGRLGIFRIQPGNYVQPGQKLVTLYNPHQLWVNFTLPVDQKDALKPGSVLTVTAPHQTSQARIIAKEPWVSRSSHTVTFRALLDTPGFAPGALVQVKAHQTQGTPAFQIPNIAVLADLSGSYVYVAHQGHAVRRPIHRLDQSGSFTYVDQGVKKGDHVITQGHQMLFPGAPIKHLPPHEPIS